VNPTSIITSVIPQLLAGGGPQVVILLLLVMLAAFFFERKRLLGLVEKKEAEIDKKDTKIEKVINDYQTGNTTLTEAFTQLRILLAEIKGKL
jgi:hypothetical protein